MLGYIDNRLKYVARKSKAFLVETADGIHHDQERDGDSDVSENNDEVVPTTSGEIDTKMRDLLNEMKSWAVDVSDLDSMKSNLRKTRDFREKMLLNNKTDLLESFPYFFVNIDLVRI